MYLIALLIAILMPFSTLAMENPSEEKLALKSALDEYSTIASSGGWPQIPSGKTLRPGMEDPHVQELSDRLLAEGYDVDISESPDSNYSGKIVEAVKEFQHNHNLTEDGVVGVGTLSSMNVPVQDRIKQIQANIERLKMIPKDLGKKYIFVNIPGFTLKAIDNGKEVLQMRIIAGQSYHPTPVFSSYVSEVIFHPYWYPTDRLDYEYVLPKIIKNPKIVETDGYELFKHVNGHTQKVDIKSINLKKLTQEDFKSYSFRQLPGLKNAMGAIKFPLNKNNSIYLHDTPAKELFIKNVRDLSNGCIRMEKPLDLAKFAMRGLDGWNVKHIEDLYNSPVAHETASIHVRLVQPIPVYILYLTTMVSQNGKIQFYNDIYGLDDKVLIEKDH